MITELHYFRVACDEPGCESYINCGAADDTHLVEVLNTNKWLTTGPFTTVYCPKHHD